MKLKYKVNDKLEFELEGSGQKEVFKELATIQEIFGEESCGVCGIIMFIFQIVAGTSGKKKKIRTNCLFFPTSLWDTPDLYELAYLYN